MPRRKVEAVSTFSKEVRQDVLNFQKEMRAEIMKLEKGVKAEIRKAKESVKTKVEKIVKPKTAKSKASKPVLAPPPELGANVVEKMEKEKKKNGTPMRKPTINFPAEEKKIERVKFVRPAGVKTPVAVKVSDEEKAKARKEILALSKKGGGVIKVGGTETDIPGGLDASSPILTFLVNDLAETRARAKK